MKQYDSYKDSGIEWIGEVPSHWKIVPLKFTGEFGNGLTYSPKDVVDYGIWVLRSSNIQNSSLSFEDNVYVSNVSKALLVQKGDVIICSRNGSAALVGKSAFIDKDINATFGAFMMRYIPKINKKYGFYLFQTAISRYKGYFATTTINQLTKSTIGEMKVPLANTEEQTAIVDFLDNKCSEIDKVISAQQKRIALLQELKQSVITHAVTKGLNPNVEMKDSGVEWIGEVPSHWEIVPLKFTGKFGNGLTYSPKDVVDYGILVLRSSNIQKSSLSFEDNVYVSNVSKALLVQKGDVIICSRNGSAALVGKSAFIDKDINATFGAFMMRYIPKINKKYGFYLFQTAISRYKGYFATTTINQLTKSTIGEMKVPLANTEEQTAIVDFLDKKCASIDSSISKAQHQVELLQEYKQSLITEVVTGKRKV